MHDWLPAWLDAQVLGWTATLSVVLFLASAIGVPYVLVRLPADYFTAERGASDAPGHPSVPRLIWLALKNALGVVLVGAGILMLVLPGQGLITIGVGLCLLNFPGRRRFVRWLVCRKSVLGPINAWRRRRGKEPLLAPADDSEP